MSVTLIIVSVLTVTILIFIGMRMRKPEKKETIQSGMVRFIVGFLDFLWVLQWIGLTVTLVLSLYVFIRAPRFVTDVNKIPVTISSQQEGTLQFGEQHAYAVEIDSESSKATVMNPLPAALFVVNLLRLVLHFALFIMILYMLRKIVQSLAAGDPFIQEFRRTGSDCALSRSAQ